MLLFVYYSTTLNNTDISTLNKDKASASINSVEAYNKEILSDEIYKLIATNVQLMINKIKTEKARVNLEADRTRLFDEKNSLVVKREKLRTEIAVLNTAGPLNVPVYKHQDPFLRLIQDKLKAKRLTLFDGIKKNF